MFELILTGLQHLLSWDDGDVRQPHSIKGIIAELVACLGPEVASQGIVVDLG